eukprot:351027-Chlamydomonas_euryale.AAC.4
MRHAIRAINTPWHGRLQPKTWHLARAAAVPPGPPVASGGDSVDFRQLYCLATRDMILDFSLHACTQRARMRRFDVHACVDLMCTHAGAAPHLNALPSNPVVVECPFSTEAQDGPWGSAQRSVRVSPKVRQGQPKGPSGSAQRSVRVSPKVQAQRQRSHGGREPGGRGPKVRGPNGEEGPG